MLTPWQVGWNWFGACIRGTISARFVCTQTWLYWTGFSGYIDTMGLYCSEVPMIEKWLVVRGLTLADYISHLWEGRTSDGLELWMASLAMNTPINVFMEHEAFSTSVTGLDLSQPSLVLTSFYSGVWCREGEEEASAVEPPPSLLTLRRVGGHPCVWEQEISSSSSGIDTNPDDLFEVDSEVKLLSMPSGHPCLRMCPVCRDMLGSGLALECHLHLLHLLSCCFSCSHCEATFNNLHQVSSHMANVHRRLKVTCKQCDYTTVSWAKMRQHVWKHTKGLRCSKYKSSFLIISAVVAYEHLYEQWQDFWVFTVFQCVQEFDCFAHSCVKATFGQGYLCRKCNAHFDTPV